MIPDTPEKYLVASDVRTGEQYPPNNADLTQVQRIQFDECVAIVIAKGDNSSLNIWISIRNMLRQFNLLNTYSESYILNVAYLRGIEAIQKGKTIVNPAGWIRVTAFNYVRELSRTQKKRYVELDENHTQHCLQDPSQLEDFEDADPPSDRVQQMRIVRAALQKLQPLDQQVLKLKVIEGLSWKRISTILHNQGHKTYSVSTLRKRKSRALAKLHEQYDDIITEQNRT